MDLSSFDISVVPGRKVCSRCYSQLSDISKDPREYKLSKSIHSPMTTNKPPVYKDANLSDTDIDIQKTHTRLTQVLYLKTANLKIILVVA